jgi:sporulation protein YlmC with PRC-barrel domain
MIRKLLVTTAISLLATTGAWSAGTQQQATSPEATQEGYFSSVGDAALASNLIGETVYTSEAADAEQIGDINDLVVGDDGTIEAVVIGVGGFLGVGEKNVAVSFDKIRWTEGENGTQFVVFEASKESLQNAPEFKAEEETAMAPSEEAASSEEPAMAPTDETAMAPSAGSAEGESAVIVPEGEVSTDQSATAPSADVTDESAETAAAEQPTEDSAETAAAPAEEPVDQSTETETAMAPTDQPADAAATDQPPTEGLSVVESGSVSAEQLLGATVYSSDQQNIGEVGDVRLAAGGGEVDAMIVDVGGFLGIGEKPVAIGFEDLEIRKDQGDAFYVYTDFTREELEAAPGYDEATYDEQRDNMRLTMRANQ